MIFTIKDGISYELNKNNFTAQVVSSSNAKGSVFIPRSINYQSNEYLILKIKESSFQLNLDIKSIDFPEDSALLSIEKNAFSKSSLQEISIPSSVEELQEGWCKHTSSLTTISLSPKNSFFKLIDEKLLIGKSNKNSEKFDALIFGCRNIQKVTIPSYIKRIESFAFSECKSLSDISFSDNSELLFIGRDAFSYTSIKSLTIPSKVEELSDKWCRKTSKLKHVSISSENKNFSIIDDKFIVGKSNKNNDKFDVLLFANRDISKAEIPSYIKKIYPFAFSECKNLSSIELSENSELNSIERNAFCYSSIQSLFIPPKVEVLKDGWCKNIYKLNHVSVSLKNENFSCINNKFIVGKSDKNNNEFNVIIFGCRNVERVNIPKNIQKIGSYSFSGCRSLQSVDFENDSQLQSFGKDCFSQSSIESMLIPPHVRHIGDRSFYKCEKLKSIQFAENSELEIIGRKSFVLTSIESISIPSKVQQIGERCFQDCEILKKVIFSEESELNSIDKYTFSSSWIENINIPNKVTRISERAFSYCKNLKTIKFEEESQLEIIEKNSFFNSNLERINFPSQLKELQEGWCSYTNRLTHISISNNNPNYKYYDNKIIIGKNQETETKSETETEAEYENLIFARRDINEITIPNYIKQIKAFAFNGCRNIKKIEFPKDSKIESIFDEAFSYSSLEEISFPANVKEIGGSALYWCKSLQSVHFPENSQLQEFSKKLFFNTPIEDLFIPSNIKKMNREWCDFLTNLKKISVSSKNKYFSCIDDNLLVKKSNENDDEYDTLVFASRNIDSLVIPSYIKKIGPFCFSWCKKLKQIEFSKDSKLQSIDKEAFAYSTLENIIIPSTVTYIGENAFYKCLNLKSIFLSEDSELTSIGAKALAYTPIESLFIPSKVKEIKEGWCKHTPKLTNITISKENQIFAYYDNKIIINENQKSIIFCRRDIKEIEIPKYIKEIKSYSFCECSQLKTITIPEESELTTIEEGTFIKTSIEEIYFPQQLEEVQEGWCKHTNKLKHIKISPNNENFKYINNQYLLKRTMNTNNNNNTNEEEYDQLIFANRNINEIIIPKHIKRIGSYSFQYCQNLETIKFEENSKLLFIDKNSFSKSSLSHITIPSHVKEIDDNAFYKCDDLKSAYFDENSELISIGKEAFAYSAIESISIPSKVQQIGERCFQECENLKKVIFSEESELNSIDKYTFSSSWIENINIPNKVTRISERAFSYCKNLKTIKFEEDSQLEIIEKNSFFNSNLERINFPSQLKELQEGWCSYTNRLTHISISNNNPNYKYYDNKIIIGKNQETETKSETETEAEYENLIFARRDINEITIPNYIKQIKAFAFHRCDKLKHIIIDPESELEYIGQEAFSCTSIENIFIPTNVQEIGERAFYWCRQLDTITFSPETKLRRLNKEIFYYSSIEKLYIPKSIEEMKEGWCDFTWKLKYISISPNNKHFKYIDNKIIVGKTDEKSDVYDVLVFASRDIDEITIPSYITKIDAFAFSWCLHLKSIFFSEYSKLSLIENAAFSFTSFQKIVIPPHVKKIGFRAFYRCSDLRIIEFSEDSELASIEKEAFAYTPIESLFIPSKVKEIKEGWCKHTPKLTNMKISKENQIFTYYDNKIIINENQKSIIFCRRDIKEIEIPKHIKEIKSYSFCECSQLKTITIPEESELTTIEEGTFIKTSIEEIYFPQQLEEVQEGWCKHTNKLKHIKISPNNENFKYINNQYLLKRTMNINNDNNNTNEEYDQLIFANRNINEIIIPKHIKRIGSYSFQYCQNLETIKFEENSKLRFIDKNSFSKSSLSHITIPSHVKEIDDNAFYKCDNLKSIEFSKNSELILINDKAFSLTPIEKISIPSKVRIIGERAFYSCTYLESVLFAEDSELVNIEKRAFELSSIKKILIPSKVNQIEERAFYKCRNLCSVDFNADSQLHLICEKAFSKTSIEIINIPSQVEEVKDCWCNRILGLIEFNVSPNNKYFTCLNKKLLVKKSDQNDDDYDTLVFVLNDVETVKIPSSIKTICSNAFCGCQKLKNIIFSEDSKLYEINRKAFSKSSIQSISIPSKVKYIRESAFNNCINLVSCDFSKNSELISIDSLTFYETALENIIIPSNVTIIDSKAFQFCFKLKSIEFTEDSKLLSIEKDAFYNLSNLEKINLPSSLKELKEGWINRVENLKYVSIANNNKRYKYILDKFIVGKNQEEDSEYENLLFARRDIDEEIIIPNYIKRIEESAFYKCSKLKHVTIDPESELEYIGQEAFSCTSIENIFIPTNVQEIGERAFYWCRQLNTITFSPETKLRRFNKEIFYYSSIEKLHIPKSIEEMKEGWCDFTIELTNISVSPESTSFLCIDDKLIIGKSSESSHEYDVLVFASRDIKNAFIPSFIKRIGKYAFSWCRKLESITFANNSNLQSIDNEAFCYSTLQNIVIPPDVDYIGRKAFYDCANLQSITFSENSRLKKIGKNSFSDSIESIFIPASIEQMEEGWCSELQKLVNVSISSENKNFSLFENQFILGKSDKSSDEFDVLIFARRDIEKVVIPSFVKQIGSFSFSFCDKLKSIEFSENSQINSIEKSAFQNSSLKSISFPSSLKELNENWCQKVDELINIKISPENEAFSLIDDQIVVGKSKNSDEYENLLFASRFIERAHIPSSIKCIHSFAFQKCKFLKYINFGENSNLNKINQNAFNNSSLRSISIPKHVKFIDKCAFSDCLNLYAVEFLGDHVLINDDIFMHCKSIFLFSCPNAKKVEIEQNSFTQFSNDLVIMVSTGSLVI